MASSSSPAAISRLDLPIAGAVRVALHRAFVTHHGQLPDPFAPPEISGDNFVAIAAAIVDDSHSPEIPFSRLDGPGTLWVAVRG